MRSPTDAKVAELDLKTLQDDRTYFPQYQAVILSRSELRRTRPKFVDAMNRIVGEIDEERMMQMNSSVEINGDSESIVAASFLNDRFDLQLSPSEISASQRIWQHTIEHMELVRRLLNSRHPRWRFPWDCCGQVSSLRASDLGSCRIIQTIPALALLVLLMPTSRALGWSSVGPGPATAVLALFLYSLLPIVRNTTSGLKSVAGEHLETATALGLTAAWRMHYVELPLALRTILAGIKTAAVQNVGFATLGALIGAGGYGQPILTGIRLNRFTLILQGAVPAALLAIVVQAVFELVGRWLMPRGLRRTQVT